MRDLYPKILSGMLVSILFSITNMAFAQTVRINEFMALNETVFTDEDGDYSDWIEIHNAGGIAVDLQDWALTDEQELPDKWLFPDISLNAGEYLIVFASGKNHAEPGDTLHTNFKLGGSGEYLALSNPAGTVVTEFNPSYPAQQTDYSYGFYEGGYIEFSDPTPGEDNSVSTGTVTPAPTFNVQHGFFEAPFNLTISATLPGNEIYYTLDGSAPSKTNGTLYNSAISVSTTTVIRAVAYVDGMNPSISSTQTYLFLDDVILQDNSPEGYPEMWGPYSQISGDAIADYEMDPELMADTDFANSVKEGLVDIPTVSLVTDKDHLFSHSRDEATGGIYIYTGSPVGDPIGRGWERPVSFEYFDPNSSASLQVNCGIRLQGGHGRLPEKLPKHSFLLAFKSEYGPSKLEHSFFGEEGSGNYDKLILRGGFGNSWVHHSRDERNRSQYQRDIWTKDTQRDMGHPASNSVYVHLYINGIYWGIFAPSERMDSDFGAKYLGGSPEDYDVIKDRDELADGEWTAWQKLMEMANAGLVNNDAYQRIQGKNPDGSPNPEIESMVDVVNLADYMLINFYGSNSDWDHHNWAVMRNRVKPGKGFKFLCWDGEHMIKNLGSNNLNENNDNCPSRIFQKLMENDEFKRVFADRVQKHCYSNGALTPEAAAARWMKRSDQVETSIVAESARWGDYRRDVHQYQPGDPSNFDLYTYADHWLPQHGYMLNTYFPNRTEEFLSQLRSADMFPNVDAPVILINNNLPSGKMITMGDELSLTAPEGTIYYTTSGIDPVRWQSGEEGNETVFVAENANKKVLVPKSDIGTSWYSEYNFDDSGWQVCSGAPGGVGYEKGSGYEDLISLDVGNDMHDEGTNPNPSCYIRIPFRLESGDLNDLTSLLLKMRYDDGFVAYLNGVKVVETNQPGTLSWNSIAPENHEADYPVSFNISSSLNLLVAGDNFLAIHGLNRNTSSSDFIINASLIASDAPLDGEMAEEAIQYEGPVSMNQSAHVIARSFHNAEWSAASDAFFIIPDDYHDIKVTEIHYNPLAEAGIDGGEYEFIELKNTGTATLDMGGLQFTTGIGYEFPPDTELRPEEFIVLSSNAMNFYSRYNFAAFDEYSGKLDNNGEWLVLETSTNDTIVNFRYNDAGDWPALPDGQGNSLVPIVYNPENDQSLANDWRASYLVGGSPGADDTPPDAIPITEIIPDGDFILAQNYPNPFSDKTYIDYQLSGDANIQLSIYNIMGQQIATLVSENQAAGLYQVEWDGSDQGSQYVPNGIYIYRLSIRSSSKSTVLTQKLMLMR